MNPRTCRPDGRITCTYHLAKALVELIERHRLHPIKSGPGKRPARTPVQIVSMAIEAVYRDPIRLDWHGEGTDQRTARMELPGGRQTEVHVSLGWGQRWRAHGQVVEVVIDAAASTWPTAEEAMAGVEQAIRDTGRLWLGVRL